MAVMQMVHVRWRGQITGPYPASAVIKMLRENRISKFHEVSKDGKLWQPAARATWLSDTQEVMSEGRDINCPTPAGTHGGRDVSFVRPPYMPPNTCGEGEGAEDQGKEGLLCGILGGAVSPWIFVFGLAPMVFGFFQEFMGVRFSHTAWLFSAYFCVLWAWILGALTGGVESMWRRGLGYGLFTAFVGIVMLFTWQAIPWVRALYAGTQTNSAVFQLLGFVFGVGLFEELCKVSPVLLFGLQARTLKTGGHGLYWGMMSGLGFAMSEGVQYTVDYWSSAVGMGASHIQECIEKATDLYGTVQHDAFLTKFQGLLPMMFEQYGSIVVAQLIRFMSLPLLHAAWAGVVGYAAAVAVRNSQWSVLFGGLGLSALLHGLYNFFSPGVLSLVTATISIALTLGLMAHEQRISRNSP